MAARAVAKESTPLVPVPAVVAALVVLGLGAAGYLYSRYGYKPAEPGAITAEAKAYVRSLKLSDVEMKATGSYLGQDIVEIVGKIGNVGDRPVKLIEISCIFYDPYSQVVRRVRLPIVKASSGGLAPGETKPFRLAFDDIPASWNKSMPQLVIAQIVF